MERTLATLGSLILGVALAVTGTSPARTTEGAVPTTAAQPQRSRLQRVLVAVTPGDATSEPSALAALTTRLHLADPAATAIVFHLDDPARTIGPFLVTIEPPAAPGVSVTSISIRAGGAVTLMAPVGPIEGEPASPALLTVIEVMGDATGIVAHRTGRLELTLDELRLPVWRLPREGTDAVAIDGAWWSLGPTRSAAEPPASAKTDRVRARLERAPVSAMRRLVDVSVGDVTADGTPDIALSFRRRYRRTLLNAPVPRSFWTDADGLSAHVGLYRMDDLSEIWVAGTLVRPVRRLAACTGALAVAYSTLRRPRMVATSAWRWQGFAFLPLPELPGRGTPTCIDIDRDGRSEAAIMERS